MYKYEVGTKFPHEKYLGHGEITVAILNENLFDVLVCLHKRFRRRNQSLPEGQVRGFIICE